MYWSLPSSWKIAYCVDILFITPVYQEYKARREARIDPETPERTLQWTFSKGSKCGWMWGKSTEAIVSLDGLNCLEQILAATAVKTPSGDLICCIESLSV